MEIKAKTVKPKEASVNIGLDVVSAEVLRLFMVKAVDKIDMSEVVLDIFADLNEEVSQESIETMLAELISGLGGEA